MQAFNRIIKELQQQQKRRQITGRDSSILQRIGADPQHQDHAYTAEKMHPGPIHGPDPHHVQRRQFELMTHAIEACQLLSLHGIGFDLAHARHIVMQQTIHRTARLSHRTVPIP